MYKCAAIALLAQLIEGGHSSHIGLIGVEIVGWLGLRPLALCLFEFRENGSDDAGRHLVLQIEDVGQRAVEPVRPDVDARRGDYELPCDAHPAARLASAALQHVAHAELAAYLLHIDRAA